MAENTTYGRLEEKIDKMQAQMQEMHSDMAQLRALNQQHVRNIERVEIIERDLNQARGVVRVVQWGGIALISACFFFIADMKSEMDTLSIKITDVQFATFKETSEIRNSLNVSDRAINNLKIESARNKPTDEKEIQIEQR